MANPCAGSPPAITKAFGAATIPLGQTTTLTFTITNPNPVLDLTGVDFTDTLPAGLQVVGAVSGPACGPFIVSGLPNSINVTNATVVGGGTCILTATVMGLAPGIKNNSTSVIRADDSDSPGNSASASIIVVAPPSISKAFGAASIPLNGSTSLSFTITNPNSTVAFNGVGFTDNLPAGLVVATPNGLTNTCGGTATATAGSGTISLSGATVAVSSSCLVTVNVTSTTAGAKINHHQVIRRFSSRAVLWIHGPELHRLQSAGESAAADRSGIRGQPAPRTDSVGSGQWLNRKLLRRDNLGGSGVQCQPCRCDPARQWLMYILGTGQRRSNLSLDQYYESCHIDQWRDRVIGFGDHSG
jgi:uncharacterized repeat protein (TIGR01451 family)